MYACMNDRSAYIPRVVVMRGQGGAFSAARKYVGMDVCTYV